MSGPRADTLLQFMLFIELFTLKPALDGLRDDEFFWEPVDGCWSVRRRGDSTTPSALGKGEWVVDYDDDIGRADIGSPVHPVTTIGWNLAHIAPAPGRLANLDVLGGQTPAEAEIVLGETTHTAAAAADQLWAGWRGLDVVLHATSDAELERSWTWPFGQTNGYQHVALVLNEVSHHATQVCELRDLYRASGGARFPRRS